MPSSYPSRSSLGSLAVKVRGDLCHVRAGVCARMCVYLCVSLWGVCWCVRVGVEPDSPRGETTPRWKGNLRGKGDGDGTGSVETSPVVYSVTPSVRAHSTPPIVI